jgi:hypothetical protein
MKRFVKYIGSFWQQICLTTKILVVTVFLFVLLLVVENVSLYINVNSGGLETVSGTIFLESFFVFAAFFLLLPILVLICVVVAIVKIDEPINLFITVVAIVVAIASFNGRFYLGKKIKLQPEPDLMRCVGFNLQKCETLRAFGPKLKSAKNDEDLTFTNDWIEGNLTDITPSLMNSHFVLNANLLNKKPSQLPDNIVVIFESNVTKGNTGGPNDISTWWHYGRGSLMVFGDGRAEFVKTEDFNNLQWQP